MKLLLTSNGIANASIERALVELLGKPISDSTALFIPTAIYPYPGGGRNAMQVARGESRSRLCNLGWKSLELLELTALPSIPRASWFTALEQADTVLVWGGNVLYLSYWLRASGVADVLPSLEHLVYVGVSAGSIATTRVNCDLESNREIFAPASDVMAGANEPLGLVDFALWVHLDNPNPIFADHTTSNIERWAASVPFPTYAIDDETAIKVDGDRLEVVSEGHWRRFDLAL